MKMKTSHKTNKIILGKSALPEAMQNVTQKSICYNVICYNVFNQI